MTTQTIILISVLLQLTPALVDVNNIEIPEEKLDESESESGGKKNLILLPAPPFLHHLFILIILNKLQLFCLSSLCFLSIPGGDFALISGVAGFSVGLQCDISPALAEDQLLLILWYKIGLPSPVYT